MDEWSVSPEFPGLPIWYFAWIKDSSVPKVEEILGEPLAEVHDSTKTIGGPEKWWCFERGGSDSLLVCLSVPTGFVRIFSSTSEGFSVPDLPDEISSMKVQLLEQPVAW